MATANLPPGAVPTHSPGDPFTASPSRNPTAPLRYAAFDNEQFSLYSTNSPASAKRAIEAHLKDTDRRLQDASRLGNTLVQQRKDLASKLKEVEQLEQDAEMPDDLRTKLANLEREYNEVGRESARAFIPKSRVASETEASSSGVISGSGRESPTKMAPPSRRQRNQPSNRVHDIEFATEISTSLLSQVRQLQAALAEKDDALKDTTAHKAQLELESAALLQRLRHHDESEQKYKDENWNLETRLQEMEASLKEGADKENRLAQTLKSTQTDKAAKERELDELKVSHDRLTEDQAMAKKVQEADLHGLRRDAAIWDTDRLRMQKKVEELTAQNTELARAVSFRFNPQMQSSDIGFLSAEEGVHSDDASPEASAPPSPIKGTPARHGMLESDTLKSSLNHAHRMIQNLKNNIHREKTEKIELKRMLQDVRDELESRRDSTGVSANVAKKRKNEPEGIKFKRASNSKLGASRSSTTEVIDEPDWEDHDSEATPSKQRSLGVAAGSAAVGAAATTAFTSAHRRSESESTDAFETANETDTGFETATERGGATESEAFATGAENFDNDTEGEATETEANTTNKTRPVGNLANKSNRMSYMSTASTSGDEGDEIVKTPVHNTQQPKYRLRLGRGGRKTGHISDIMSDSPQPSNASPHSSMGTPQATGQSLGDELDGLDNESLEGTPISTRDLADTPATSRHISLESGTPTKMDEDEMSGVHPVLSSHFANLNSHVQVEDSIPKQIVQKAEMVDVGMMTEPWEPERTVEKQSITQRAAEVAGGALAGFGLSRFAGKKQAHDDDGHEQADPGASNVSAHEELSRQMTAVGSPAPSTKPTQMITIGTDARGTPVTISTGTDARVIPTNTIGTDASAPRQMISIGTDARGNPVTISIGTATDAESQPKTLLVADLPTASYEPSPITSQDTDSEMWPLPPNTKGTSESRGLKPLPSAAVEQTGVREAAVPAQLALSEVVCHEMAPVVPEQPSLPRRSSNRLDGLYAANEFPEATSAVDKFENGGASSSTKVKSSTALFASSSNVMPATDRSAGTARNAIGEETLQPTVLPQPSAGKQPLGDRSHNILSKVPMADEGSQTLVSGDEIDMMVKNKNAVAPIKDSGSSPFEYAAAGAATGAIATAAAAGAPNSPTKRYHQMPPSVYEPPNLRNAARPPSAGSMRASVPPGAPPLPPDHNLKIAAAAQQQPTTPVASTSGTMGPPIMPASAYKSRPNTPGGRPFYERNVQSRDSTTPRAARTKDSQGHVSMHSDRLSHRTSVSSFASELDERFNITRGQIMYPVDVEPSTDPRMIQAITQTMIGEYLWKYTRKAGRSETSTTRHRRFFWVHPYTRTLYWSEQDPSTAGKNMLKAKSVAIEAVRVISDDNAYPPGLHRKSIVVITPGRDIVFTAPTGQRHETWFNALSYLLLRTEKVKAGQEEMSQGDDMEEWNPGSGFGGTVRRSLSRMAGGTTTRRSQSRQSRTSLSSYNSRTTRTTSPPRREGHASTSQPLRTTSALSFNNGLASTQTNQSRVSSGGVSNRISSMASRFKSSGGQRAHSSFSNHGDPADPAGIYEASVINDSAEDLRAVIARQEREADRLENVRACCDGKHDVGSLTHRHSKHTFRVPSHSHGPGHQTHSHGTASSRR